MQDVPEHVTPQYFWLVINSKKTVSETHILPEGPEPQLQVTLLWEQGDLAVGSI